MQKNNNTKMLKYKRDSWRFIMSITIGGRVVGNDTKTLIIAEAGINHDGKLEQAYQLIDIAADAGADVVKFQLFTAAHMYPIKAGKLRTANGMDMEIYPLIKEMEVPEEWIPKLINKCKERDIGFLCTTCDETSTDLLNKYSVDSFKIASSEITHIPLLRHTANTGKTVIFSEGAAKMSEVCEAIDAIKATGNEKIALMHCTAEYPAKLSDCNTNIIETYRRIFPDVIIGFSDHTSEPSTAPVQAILKGAKIIEKHITIDRKLPGADHSFALEYNQLKQLVQDVRFAEEHLDQIIYNDVIGGRTDKIVLDDEKKLRSFVHRGIFSYKDIKAGETLTTNNMIVLRPGNCENGIEPRFFDMLIEKKVCVNNNISSNCPIKWDDVLNF